MLTATAVGMSASYSYDPAGLRLAKTVNGQTTYTVRGASGDVLSEYRAPCAAPVWAKDTIYAAGRAIVAVRSTAPLATVALSSATASVNEGAGNATVTAVLQTPGGGTLPCAVTVAYEAKVGTATTADFTIKSGTVTFPAGSAHLATQPIAIPVTPDTLDEADETFFVDLSSAIGGALGATGRTTVTIVDDDPLPSVSIQAELLQYEGHVGVTNFTLNVFLSAASGRTVQVSYASSSGTAIAGQDYQAVSGTLIFQPGEFHKTITVPVYGDLAFEPHETVVVTLSNPVHATLSLQHQAVVTIVNDDAARNTWGDFYAPRDGSADATLFNPSTRVWTIKDSNIGNVGTFGPFGDVAGFGDVFVPADYNGDGITDCAVYRPGTGIWTIAPSCTSSGHWTAAWGGDPSDVPVPADYDGDGRADYAVYRRATNLWYVTYSSTGGWAMVEWGWNWTHVIPTPGDYDGDGRADFAYYAPFNSSWWIYFNTGGVTAVDGWVPGETVITAPGDYDGDSRTDYAFYRPATGYWHVLKSTTGAWDYVALGVAGAVPVAADYDGDGRVDPAYYNPSDRTFSVSRSSNGQMLTIPMAAHSQPGDIPVLRRPQ
jgi:hypothetical protein